MSGWSLLLLLQGGNYFVAVGNRFFETPLFSDKLGVGHGLEVFVSECAAAWHGEFDLSLATGLPLVHVAVKKSRGTYLLENLHRFGVEPAAAFNCNCKGVDEMEWLYVVLTVAVATFFYWLRCRSLPWYGFSELVVALLLIYLAFFPHTNNLLLNRSTVWDTILTEPVKIFAGIYAFVRGCDNIVTGLRKARDF
jgi:hypothetical protein